MDEGEEDAEGPWGRQAKAWGRSGDEPKIAFFLRIMVRHERWSRRRHKDIKMIAAERLPKTVCPQSRKVLGYDGGGAQPAHRHCERCVIYRPHSRNYFRSEEPSRRRGRYTKMTASRRPSRGAKQYLCRGTAESSKVYRMNVTPIFPRSRFFILHIGPAASRIRPPARPPLHLLLACK